ncbi:MAG: nucleotide exchange factor GrpE [Candidatus Falkowbacteria bacterium]
MPEEQLDQDVLENDDSAALPVDDSGAELEQKYLRALADYQNLLRQTAKEKQETIKFGNQRLLEELLPVYSNLKTALQHIPQTDDNWLEGLRIVIKQFKDVLAAAGVMEIVCEGQAFDHNSMDALSEQATVEEALDGTVAKEAVSGYLLNGRVIMPAKVIVYKFKNKE